MEKKCLKCGKLHDGNYGSGKYCNVKCANSRVRSEEVKKKISEGVKKSKSWEKINRETFDKEKQIKSLKETWRKKRPKWDEVHISTKKRWLKEDIGECQMCGLKEWLNFDYGDTIQVGSFTSPQINGFWLVKDCMNKRYKNSLDFLFDSENNKPKLGVCKDLIIKI